MTNKEAKTVFFNRGYVEVEGGTIYDANKWRESCVVISEWLEQEPCNDAISRQSAIDANCYNCSIKANGGKCSKCDAVKTIEKLPPVKPQEQTGHWIMPVNDDGMSDIIYYQVRCSKCGFDLDPQTWDMELHQYDADKYCPKCGAEISAGIVNTSFIV
jgi:GH43 family beta-xylosidase